MNEERKKEIDRMWINSDLGKWTVALSQGHDEDADKILRELFEKYPSPYEYLMMQERELYKKMKEALSHTEGKEYMLKLEEENANLLDVMVAHEFSMLGLYDE